MDPHTPYPGSPDDLFLTAPIGIYRSSLDGTIEAANPALARLLGYADPRDLLTHNMRDLYLDPDERDRLIAVFEPSGQIADVELQWKRADGSPVWVTLTAHAVKEVDGATRFFQGFVRDLSHEREQQYRMRVSETRLRTVIETTHHAVWDWDLATDEVVWGEGFASLFGFAPDERSDIAGWRQRVHPDDVDRVSASLELAIAEGRNLWYEEYRFRRDKGDWAIVADQGRVLHDEQGRPLRMVGAMRDLTLERMAEDHVRHAQRMEAVGQLTGGIAHDFNNILTVVLANAELLASTVPPDVAGAVELRDIREAARRGQTMVRKLLGFARRAPLEMRRQDLSALVTEAGSMLRRLIAESITVQLETGGGPHDIAADAGAVEQILVNLTTNARDAMPDGGTLRVGVHHTYVFDAPEHVEGARPGTYVCLTVSDTGTGIPADVREHMFEPFYTTKPPDRGTGLGLAMVFGLVRQHDGFVQVQSAEGEGTVMRVYFPTAARDVRQPQIETPRSTGPAPHGALILLVEDEDEVRSAAQRVLERLAYRVVTAADGEAGLELFEQHAAEIRLVLTDVVMPKRNGPQLVAAIRARGSDVPVLFASGYPARDLEAEASLPPDAPLLRKPWTVEELRDAVREALSATTAT
ncbi:MAG: PAS domain-containing protein [Gemmatimonadales bacterium]